MGTYWILSPGHRRLSSANSELPPFHVVTVSSLQSASVPMQLGWLLGGLLLGLGVKRAGETLGAGSRSRRVLQHLLEFLGGLLHLVSPVQ